MLKKQIADMEAFLADYGLQWVGVKDDSHPIPTEQFQLDIDLLKRSVKELNVLAGTVYQVKSNE